MPLLSGDIRFARSANMTDVSYGGGPPSSQLLTSGRSNEIMPDISEETRTVGRVEIYQIHGVLRNTDTTPFLGSNVILAEPAEDPNISITLLSLKDPFATRADIARRIESGMSAGSEMNGYLLEAAYTTMKSIQVLQRPGMKAPAIGKTFVLVYNEGQSSERRARIRVKAVATETRIFTEVINNNLIDFEAQVTTCELFDGLPYDFPGSPASRSYARQDDKTLIRETIYSDAGMFYSASKLTVASQINDTWLSLASVYVQIVPNSRSEVATVDQRPAARKTLLLASAPRRVEVGITPHSQRIKIAEENAGQIFVAQLTPLPEAGTTTIEYWSLGQLYTISDDGTGRMTGAGGGALSLLTGAMSFTLNAVPDIGSCINISHGSRVSYTDRSGQGANVRAPEYLVEIAADTEPAQVVPGSLVLKYTSGNVERVVTESGNGQLAGDATGLIDYPGRHVVLRPTFMPDPGSQFLIECDIDNLVSETFGSLTPNAAGDVVIALAQQPAAKSLRVEWTTARAVSNTSGTTLSTNAATKTSEVKVFVRADRPGVMFAYQQVGSAGTSATLTEEASSDTGGRVIVKRTVSDDGAGQLAGLGTVDYVSKSVQLRAVSFDRSTTNYKSDYDNATDFEWTAIDGRASSGSNARKGGGYGTTAIGEEMLAGVTVRYRVGAGAPVHKTQTYTPPPVVIDLAPLTTERAISGSLQFSWMGHTYSDFEGVIYRGRTDTDPGVASGTMDYASCLALMTNYVVGGTGPEDFQLQSLWTAKDQWSAGCLFFNTDAAPIRAGAGGFVLTVVDLKGGTLTANVDGQGNITGNHMRGRIEFARGAVELQFGDFVLDADLTAAEKAEWWYSAADVGAVQAGRIWRPWPVDPTTLRYSAVSYIYLPVDVSLMGLDPAALPADGRVAFVRPGDLAVIGVTHGGGAAFTPFVGQTYNLGHQRLSFVEVLGPDGAEVRTGYTADLDAGTVTFTDLTGYPAQVSVIGRTEVYRQIAEVRIDGRVKLTQPIGYAFPVGSVFSTALRFGDRFAQVSRVYDQASWSGTTWIDGVDPAAGEATATYNTKDHPVEVNNRGAITERWALRIKNGGTTFDLIGKNLGQIATGSINEDFSPMNVSAGVPYMTLRAAGWGAGWVPGNTLFIDTVGAEAPIDVVRCTQPGAPVGVQDNCSIVQRGDTGRPPESEF